MFARIVVLEGLLQLPPPPPKAVLAAGGGGAAVDLLAGWLAGWLACLCVRRLQPTTGPASGGGRRRPNTGIISPKPYKHSTTQILDTPGATRHRTRRVNSDSGLVGPPIKRDTVM